MRRKAFVLAAIGVCFALACAPAVLAQNGALSVEVTTDKVFYLPGESVTVTVRTFLDGEPVSASIVSAQVTVTLPDGKIVYSDIRADLHAVGTGVYRALGQVQAPGTRQVDVVAVVKQKVGCRCQLKVFKGQGVAAYAVQSLPLNLALFADPLTLSVCDPITGKVVLSRAAFVRLFVVFPHGVQRELVIPGWLAAGEHWIKIQPKEFFDVGPLTLKAVAVDGYGQSAEATVDLLLNNGVCDC